MKVTRVTVSFAGKIPTQNYGNIDVRVTWEADIEPEEKPEAVTQELFRRIRDEVAEAVRPIAQAKLRSAEQALQSLPQREREAFMQQFGVIQWLQAVVPEVHFANPNGDKVLEEEVNNADQGTDGTDND